MSYTVIESAYDEVVTPYTSAFLSGPDVTNITLQNQCPLDLGEHLSMLYDHIAEADVLTALDRNIRSTHCARRSSRFPGASGSTGGSTQDHSARAAD